MKRPDMIKRLREKFPEFTTGMIQDIINAISEAIEYGLVTDGEVRIKGFGQWRVFERTVQSPFTGMKRVVTKTIKFKPSQNLKDSVYHDR